jgi:hypothetical protein
VWNFDVRAVKDAASMVVSSPNRSSIMRLIAAIVMLMSRCCVRKELAFSSPGLRL